MDLSPEQIDEINQLLEKVSGTPEEYLIKTALAQVNPRDEDPVIALNTALMTGGVVSEFTGGVSRNARTSPPNRPSPAI